MFPTRLSEVKANEIRAVIETEAAEGIDFELKRGLSARKGAVDPWMTGGKLGDEAKDALAAEVIAFANTAGGALIVGIDEDSTTKRAKPPIFPLPRCKELAERLHQAISDRIEPKLPVFECEGIVTETDGTSGVIVMRTLESYLTPHRHTQDRHCYLRRNDRAEPMSMREIQEYSRLSGRRIEEMNSALDESKIRFHKWIPETHQQTHPDLGVQGKHVQNSDGSAGWIDVWAFRATAQPLAPLPLSNLLREPWTRYLKPGENFKGSGRPPWLQHREVSRMTPWYPRLRALERELTGNSIQIMDRITTEGRIERFAISENREDKRERAYFLNLIEVMWHVASVIRMADTARTESNRPAQVFALELEYCSSDSRWLGGYSGRVPGSAKVEVAKTVVFPRLEIGSRDEFNTILTTFDRDIWNLGGVDPDWELEIEWPPAAVLPAQK